MTHYGTLNYVDTASLNALHSTSTCTSLHEYVEPAPAVHRRFDNWFVKVGWLCVGSLC